MVELGDVTVSPPLVVGMETSAPPLLLISMQWFAADQKKKSSPAVGVGAVDPSTPPIQGVALPRR
jgi:hypothetical protein